MTSAILPLIALNLIGLLAVYLILNARMKRLYSAESQIRGLREEVNRLVLELNQTADRNIAILEDKIAELTETLSKADRKIGLLQRESEKHEVGAKVYSRIAEARAVQEAAAEEPEPRTAPERPVKTARDLRDRVLELHRAGFPAALISSRIGAPLGEVELVISLEKRKAAQ